MKKKTILVSTAALLTIAGIIFTLNFNLGELASSQQKKNDDLLAEQMAYHIGVQAYLYGYPLVDMYRQMHNETHINGDQQVYASVNRFYRFPHLVTPDTGGNFRAPNNDTLYYTAWFDISSEPLIIHTPDTDGRYFTIAVTNQYSEVTHIGRRTYGTTENYYALVAPHWKGELPAGVIAVPTETNKGWLLGRMLVDGQEDFNTAMALVNDIWLSPLGQFTRNQRPPLPRQQEADAIDPMQDLAFFSIMNKELKSLPPRPGEASLIGQFDLIGIGPNRDFDANDLSEASRKGLLRAIEDGKNIVEAATQHTIPDFNGWMISKQIGRYGFDYMHRASVVKGGYGNLPEESLYPATVFDKNGDLLSGSKKYRLHFEAGQEPPVNGFWSLAAYKLTDYQLAENEIRRYSIGDRTPGLKRGADGSLSILLQHKKPENENTNWLPVPAGHFMTVLRMYEPSQAALDNSYLLPRIEEIE
ncbi:MAG: DUF1214 domain-containing protein [Pseudomonadales bacterium]